MAMNKDDAHEEALAGSTFDKIAHTDLPPCAAERVSFMAPFEFTRWPNHPYNYGPESSHGHFKKTPLVHRPHTVAAVPFAWMLKDALTTIGPELDLDVDEAREPDLGFTTSWIQDHRNQRALSEAFTAHLRKEESLAFFYAKDVPFVDEPGGGRILVGVGRVTGYQGVKEYEYEGGDPGDRLRSVLYERMIHHSIRPEFEDGFVMPYHAALELARRDGSFDPLEVTAFTPADRTLEFSQPWRDLACSRSVPWACCGAGRIRTRAVHVHRARRGRPGWGKR